MKMEMKEYEEKTYENVFLVLNDQCSMLNAYKFLNMRQDVQCSLVMNWFLFSMIFSYLNYYGSFFEKLFHCLLALSKLLKMTIEVQ